MSFLKLFPSYMLWHYTTAYKDLLRLSKNFLFFIGYFFSIKTLLRSLFSPWERLGERHHKGEGVSNYASVVVVNLIMRLVGFCLRLVLILLGCISFFITVVCIGISFIVWPLLPIFVALLFIKGVVNIFA